MQNKFARKKSSDPIQESLRSAKDDWNKEVSDLIYDLIVLKRGINGRGDRNAGLPSSSIKDPLPPEVISYLSSVSNKSSKILDFARKIVDEQSGYSSSRKKSAELISEASWWGSRAIFYVKLLWKADKIERELRKRLSHSSAKFEKEFKHFEGWILDFDNPISIPVAVSDLTSILFLISSDLIPVYLQLKNLLKKVNEIKKDAPPEITEAAKTTSPVSTTVSEKEEKSTPPLPQPPPKENKNFDKEEAKLKKIRQDSTIMGVLVNLLKTKISNPNEIAAIEKIYQLFAKKLMKISALFLSQDSKEAAAKELNNLIDNEYTLLKNTFKQYFGEVKEISDYEPIIRPHVEEKKSVGEYQEFLFKQASEATNFISRFLNKKLLSVQKNPFAKIKMDTIEKSLEVRKAFQLFMDNLEKNEKNHEELSESANKICTLCIGLAEKVESLVFVHNAETREINIIDKFQKIKSLFQETRRVDLSRLRLAKAKLEIVENKL